jgi:hypothetical protein
MAVFMAAGRAFQACRQPKPHEAMRTNLKTKLPTAKRELLEIISGPHDSSLHDYPPGTIRRWRQAAKAAGIGFESYLRRQVPSLAKDDVLLSGKRMQIGSIALVPTIECRLR